MSNVFWLMIVIILAVLYVIDRRDKIKRLEAENKLLRELHDKLHQVLREIVSTKENNSCD